MVNSLSFFYQGRNFIYIKLLFKLTRTFFTISLQLKKKLIGDSFEFTLDILVQRVDIQYCISKYVRVRLKDLFKAIHKIESHYLRWPKWHQMNSHQLNVRKYNQIMKVIV